MNIKWTILCALSFAVVMTGCFDDISGPKETVSAETGYSGVISSDETWADTVKVYKITGDLSINADIVWKRKIRVEIDPSVTVEVNESGSLSIEEGVTIISGENAILEIGHGSSGTLSARGSDSLPILFTRALGTDYWGNSYSAGIVAEENATALTSLDYCIIESAIAGLEVKSPSIAITNTIIRNNKTNGILFASGAAPKDSASFVNNTITGNGEYGITIDAAGLGRLSGTGTVAGNGKGGVLVEGGRVEENAVWKKHDAPYIVTGEIDIRSETGVSVTVRPGAKFLFAKDAYIEIGYNNRPGTFVAEGTATDTIVFSNATAGSNWGVALSEMSGGIVLADAASANCSFAYCIFENATSALYSKGPVSVNNCVFRSNKRYGIFFDGGAPKDSASFLNNTITGNGEYGIRMGADGLGKLSGTGTVAGNTKGGILVDGTRIKQDAVWKKHDAPYVVISSISIRGETGAKVTIRPGAEFQFAQADTYLEVGDNGPGTLVAEGTETEPIVFTNFVEGIYWGFGGETGGGIYIGEQAGSTSLAHCTIEHANTGLFIDAQVAVTKCTLKDNKAYGITYGTQGYESGVVENQFVNNGAGETSVY